MNATRAVALALAFAALAVAAPARASWMESGQVNIVANLAPAEAEDIEPGDIIDSVTIGSVANPGEVTVVSEGDVNTRQSLGFWTIARGQGNVQSTFGEASAFTIGNSSSVNPTVGELEILNSDVTGGISVRNGALRVVGGSKVGSIRLFPLGSAYVSLGSRTQVLETDAGSYLSIDASTVAQLALQRCDLRGTALIVDSSFNSGSLDMSTGADTTMYPFLSSFSEFRIQNALRLADASFDVSGSVASTGSIELGDDAPNATSLAIAATHWTNAGDVTFSRFDGPVELVISGGSQFHEQGTVRVRNQPSSDAGLVVTGAGTELEVDEDLFVGQWVLATPQALPGTLTVADGAVVTVHGTLVIGMDAVLNLESGGTLYADAAEINGTVNENGGALIVPEPAQALGCAVAILAVFVRRRRAQR